MRFPGRRITFPIVLDDKWNKEALQRYISTTRDLAVYLPSNVEYLAKNNSLSDSNEALHKLVQSDWGRVRDDFAFTENNYSVFLAGIGSRILSCVPILDTSKTRIYF